LRDGDYAEMRRSRRERDRPAARETIARLHLAGVGAGGIGVRE
jgi:hypothetical protein